MKKKFYFNLFLIEQFEIIFRNMMHLIKNQIKCIIIALHNKNHKFPIKKNQKR